MTDAKIAAGKLLLSWVKRPQKPVLCKRVVGCSKEASINETAGALFCMYVTLNVKVSCLVCQVLLEREPKSWTVDRGTDIDTC